MHTDLNHRSTTTRTRSLRATAIPPPFLLVILVVIFTITVFIIVSEITFEIRTSVAATGGRSFDGGMD
jgi:hypothetical protein